MTESIIDKEKIKRDIENMDKNHHIEILKIIHKSSNTIINENKSGVYINLSFLSDETIREIQKYVDHVKYQEELLIPIESQKKTLKNTFYSNEEENTPLFSATSMGDSSHSYKEVPIEYITKPNKDNNVSIFSYE